MVQVLENAFVLALSRDEALELLGELSQVPDPHRGINMMALKHRISDAVRHRNLKCQGLLTFAYFTHGKVRSALDERARTAVGARS